MPTLRDIAERVGVTQGTVSAVLNNAPRAQRFSEETRQRIRTAAAELGYRVNPLARALRKTRSGMIGCLLYNQPDLYNGHMLHWAEAALRAKGYDLAIASMGYDKSRLEPCLAQMAAWRVEGLLVWLGGRVPDAAMLSAFNRFPAPCIVVDSGAPERQHTAARFNREAGRAIARHLLDLGHRKFAVLGGTPGGLHAHDRINGLREALCEAGVSFEEKHVFGVRNDLIGPSAGRQCADDFIQAGMPATAIVCVNDFIAIGALRCLNEHGVDIPGALSIATIDDLCLDYAASEANRLCAYLTPSLTAIRVPLPDVGREAAERLMRQIASGAQLTTYAAEHAPILIVRESTGPASQGEKTS
jgi:LacI family transcriptional regulator